MEARRVRILSAARETIAERGYEALTMRELAGAAGVTVPTIYNLIGSKEAVLLAAVEEQTLRFLARIAARPARRPADHVLSVAAACSRELLTLPRYYRTLLQLLFTTAPGPGPRADIHATLVAEFTRGVASLRDAGHLASWIDADVLARRLTFDLQMTALRWSAGELPDTKLGPAAELGASLLLLSATTDPETRSSLERRAAAAQRSA